MNTKRAHYLNVHSCMKNQQSIKRNYDTVSNRPSLTISTMHPFGAALPSPDKLAEMSHCLQVKMNAIILVVSIIENYSENEK
uniref:Uncharacterized protein n=1 Tax=Anguilla anguilla TaxID=7936 RepID=A0A0E9WV04_ANGAN